MGYLLLQTRLNMKRTDSVVGAQLYENVNRSYERFFYTMHVLYLRTGRCSVRITVASLLRVAHGNRRNHFAIIE